MDLVSRTTGKRMFHQRVFLLAYSTIVLAAVFGILLGMVL